MRNRGAHREVTEILGLDHPKGRRQRLEGLVENIPLQCRLNSTPTKLTELFHNIPVVVTGHCMLITQNLSTFEFLHVY